MAKSKKNKNQPRVVTLNLQGRELSLDIATDQGLSGLIELLFGVLLDISDHLNRIRWDTGPLGNAMQRLNEVSPVTDLS